MNDAGPTVGVTNSDAVTPANLGLLMHARLVRNFEIYTMMTIKTKHCDQYLVVRDVASHPSRTPGEVGAFGYSFILLGKDVSLLEFRSTPSMRAPKKCCFRRSHQNRKTMYVCLPLRLSPKKANSENAQQPSNEHKKKPIMFWILRRSTLTTVRLFFRPKFGKHAHPILCLPSPNFDWELRVV